MVLSGIENPEAAILRAMAHPRDGAHTSASLDEAEALLAAHPELADASLYVAAVLGDAARVRRWLESNPAAAEAKGGPYGWDALTWLCFSRYLRVFRQDSDRSAGFLAAARALLEAGADARSGWMHTQPDGRQIWESVLYGAAGIAHHGEMTRLLLEFGADPNDEETPYHVAEGYDLAALRVLLQSGKLNEESLTTILLRKADWHDRAGIQLLLEHGADPHRQTRWGVTALQQAVRRDNPLENVALMLGAQPRSNPDAIQTSVSGALPMAALRGRGDALRLLDAYMRDHGGLPPITGPEALLAACARGDSTAARLLAADPDAVAMLRIHGGDLLSQFAGNGNVQGIWLLISLGIDVASVTVAGDSYFSLPPGGTALHSAAWRGRHSAVATLLDMGAPLDAKDAKGQTALQLAIRACTDSFWMDRRSPESVRLLLAAGASIQGVGYPTRYAAVDELLKPMQTNM